jgi:hypothetical protein
MLAAVLSAPAVASAVDFYLPWTHGSTVRCSQGNGGSISHTSAGSRYAWDFAMSLGDPIRAAAPGTIVALRQDAADFVPNPDLSTPVNYVVIVHSDGTRTGYLHLKQNSLPADIRVGATVSQGQIVGGAGSSGYSSGVHLHFSRYDTSGVSIPLSFVEAGVPVGGVRYTSANGEPGSPPFVGPPSALTPVYRFFNGRQGVHFFTASAAEMANVRDTLSKVYTLESVAYYLNTANSDNKTPLYRFYNTKQGVHFYTASETEKNNVVATLSKVYVLEGEAYKVCATNVAGATPVYRFFNFKKGVHFYTASEAERDSVIRTLSSTYAFEGIGYYLAP